MMKIAKKILKSVALPFEIMSGFSRGALTHAVRRVDVGDPFSWEFSVFSNGGEDGILDYLINKIKAPSRSFVEIGSANGVNNNTAYLGIIKKYQGLMIEGDKYNSYLSSVVYRKYNRSVVSLNSFVTLENIVSLLHKFPGKDIDVLSIDIDGIDFFIMEKILKNGFRPKIIIVEYNATYGPEKKICIQYKADFDYSCAHPTRLYYGVSISAWKALMMHYGYDFISVDSSGVNAFFIMREKFCDFEFSYGEAHEFQDNIYEKVLFGKNHDDRFRLIEDCGFHDIEFPNK